VRDSCEDPTGSGPRPGGNLYDIVEALQRGDPQAGWLFTEHHKIKAIIRGRIGEYRRQFHWLAEEDYEDIEHGLRPRLIDIVLRFKLPEQRNEGRVVAYFKLRIRGEADFLLKRITGMRQVSDDEGNFYLKAFSKPIDGLEETHATDTDLDEEVIDGIEGVRQNAILSRLLSLIPKTSNDRIWLSCYLYRLQGRTWANVAKLIGYKQTDFAYLKDNTSRFVSRLKHRLVCMGEDVNCRICGIYTDVGDVGICVIDTVEPKNFQIWSKSYETYADLEKVEAKLGDIFRQFDITYVIMNELVAVNEGQVICMRYLSKREAFVETVDALPFFKVLCEDPGTIRGFTVNTPQRRAYQLAEIKRSHLDVIRDRARGSRKDSSNPDGDSGHAEDGD